MVPLKVDDGLISNALRQGRQMSGPERKEPGERQAMRIAIRVPRVPLAASLASHRSR